MKEGTGEDDCSLFDEFLSNLQQKRENQGKSHRMTIKHAQQKDDKNQEGLAVIFSDSALLDCSPLLWRVWSQVCDSNNLEKLTAERFDSLIMHSSLSAKDVIHRLVMESSSQFSSDEGDIYLSYIKFYERAFSFAEEDVARIESVCAVVRKHHKDIPLAVASTDRTENVINLLASVGLLHYFGAVVGQEGNETTNSSQVFAKACQYVNCDVNNCVVVDNKIESLLSQKAAGRHVFDAKCLPSFPGKFVPPKPPAYYSSKAQSRDKKSAVVVALLTLSIIYLYQNLFIDIHALFE